MPRVPFESLPADARLWVFPVHEPLDGLEVQRLSSDVESFLDSWAAHGDPLTSAYAWEEDRFLLIAVDQRSVPASGCSIDSLMRVFKETEARTGKRVLGHGPVYFRGVGGEIIGMSRGEFRDAASEGEVTRDTPVFDTTLTSLGDFRAGRLEVPARDAWHGAVFFG